jgi:hypothetical protein
MSNRRLRRAERQLRARAIQGDLHGAAIRAWLTARDLLRERGERLPPPNQRPRWWQR